MTDINSVTIVGRLTRDFNGSDQREYAFTPNGQARANISIAVNRSRKQGDQWVDEANFFNVTIWGKTAENLLPYLKKGKQICVEGYLKQDRWQDKTTGQQRSNVSIVANNVQLLGGGNASQYNPQTVYSTPQAAQMASAQAEPMRYAPPQNQPQQYQQPQQIPQNQPMQGNFPPPNDGGFPEDVPW